MAKCERKEEFLAAEVRSLALEIGYAELRITEGETDKVEVTATMEEERAGNYVCRQEDGILKIKAGEAQVRITLFGEDKKFHKEELEKEVVHITIPHGMKFEEMKLDLGAGSAKLFNTSGSYARAKVEIGAGSFQAASFTTEGLLEIEVGAGNAELQNFSANGVKLECGVGMVRMRGAVEGDIHAECGVGTIEMDLDAIENDYNYNIDCAVGLIRINGSKRGGLFSAKSSVSSPNAKGTINLECGVGKIELFTRKRLAEA